MNNTMQFEREGTKTPPRLETAINPGTPIGRLAFLGYRPSLVCTRLKNQLQRNLYLPRSPRRMRDNPKSAAPHRIRRQTEIDNVKHVKKLRPELHQPQIALPAAPKRR